MFSTGQGTVFYGESNAQNFRDEKTAGKNAVEKCPMGTNRNRHLSVGEDDEGWPPKYQPSCPLNNTLILFRALRKHAA